MNRKLFRSLMILMVIATIASLVLAACGAPAAQPTRPEAPGPTSPTGATGSRVLHAGWQRRNGRHFDVGLCDRALEDRSRSDDRSCSRRRAMKCLVQEANHDVKLQNDQIDNMVSQGVKGSDRHRRRRRCGGDRGGQGCRGRREGDRL